MMKTIEIVVPYYNESENIRPLYEATKGVFAERLPMYSHTLFFIGDSNSDDLFVVLKELSEEDERVRYLSSSRNFGHQLTARAGLDHLFADAVILTDCDQQYPPTPIPELVKRWEKDNQMVTTLRTYPPDTPKKKRKNLHHPYKSLNMLSDIGIKGGPADFRLLDQEVVKIVRKMNENEPFLRGIVPWIGLKQCYIPYTAQARFAGESKYTTGKVLHLATTGVTSFSVKPLYFVVFLGSALSTLSVFYIPYVIYVFVSGTEIPDWASLIMTITLFGGLQLTIPGIIGIYIGGILRQTKARSAYITQGKKL